LQRVSSGSDRVVDAVGAAERITPLSSMASEPFPSRVHNRRLGDSEDAWYSAPRKVPVLHDPTVRPRTESILGVHDYCSTRGLSVSASWRSPLV
jgi:hypothetical protein